MELKLPNEDGRTYSKLVDVKVINLDKMAGFYGISKLTKKFCEL